MQNSKIEWCDHTFNLVWGCQRVSPGCQSCYAETLAKRYGYDVWGPARTTERRTMSDNYWKQPLRWNAQALKAPYGTRRPRVFCSSMADVLEDHPTNNRERPRLWELIGECDSLDWLLLTKRPENILSMAPPAWSAGYWPDHVWLGTSVEDQQRANERIPHLLRVPARVRFLSCEPLLGPLNLNHYLIDDWTRIGDDVHYHTPHPALHWLIVGGESGHGARPMHPDWARSLRDQAQAAGMAYFFKQWGEYAGQYKDARAVNLQTLEGDIVWRDYDDPTTPHPYRRVGKHAAGRLLDGVEWSQFPDEVTA